jgi:3-oxoacyl-[acyl-carrier protein] reductase
MTSPSARISLVTGASRGIGLAISEELARQGMRVIGVARSRPDRWPGEQFVEADLSTPEGVAIVIDALEQHEQIWGLVNDAGRGSDQSLEELDPDEFESVLFLNSVVPALLAQACSRRMTAGGRIVNISSVVALGAPRRTSYGASKGVLISMTRTWALELASKAITVNSIAPGPIETELFRSFNPKGSPGEAKYLSQIPVGELGRPEDLAALVSLLMQPAMSYLTGQTLYFDGGFTIGRSSI